MEGRHCIQEFEVNKVWKEILKGNYSSYSTKNFKELKVAILLQIKDLEIGKVYTLDELALDFEKYYLESNPIAQNKKPGSGGAGFNLWWNIGEPSRGVRWYKGILPRIGKNSNMLVKEGLRHGRFRYVRVDPNTNE